MALLNFNFEPFEFVERDYTKRKSDYTLYFQVLLVMSDNMVSFKTILNFIERHVTEDDGWDVFSRIVSKRITEIENVEMRAILINLIKSHRKGDEDGSEIVL